MLSRTISILGVLAFGLCATEKLHLPVPTCKRDSSNYNSCLKQAINEAWPLFVKGLPEFDFPPLDPCFYKYQKTIVDAGQIHGEITATNVTFEGMAATRFKSVKPRFSDDAFHLDIDLRTPRILTYGVIEGRGTVGGFNMGGKGSFNITMEDLRVTWDISGPVKDDTWIIEHFRIIPVTKNLKVYMDNFFEGNREINDLAIMFVNEFWPALYRVMIPIAAKNWDIFFSDMLTQLFAKLSFSEVFP